jgi:hypothetical protein
MTTHQNVSKHLAVLHQAGMVSRRKQGPSVRYALVDWTGWWLVEQMGASVPAQLDELRELFRRAARTPLATGGWRAGRWRPSGRAASAAPPCRAGRGTASAPPGTVGVAAPRRHSAAKARSSSGSASATGPSSRSAATASRGPPGS